MNQTRNYPEKMALKTTFEIIITKKNISNYDSKISVKKKIFGIAMKLKGKNLCEK